MINNNGNCMNIIDKISGIRISLEKADAVLALVETGYFSKAYDYSKDNNNIENSFFRLQGQIIKRDYIQFQKCIYVLDDYLANVIQQVVDLENTLENI